MENSNFDFSGWATKNDLRCADGKIIRKNAFKVNDGQKVPLVWNHQHDSVHDILGHAILENREEGVYAYCKFNNTSAGQAGKEAVSNGDVTAMSIWANNLDHNGTEVFHGVIREVSLVLAGANPGAFIESVMIHGMSIGEDDGEGLFYTGENLIIPSEVVSHADESKDEGTKDEGSETVKDVLNTLTDKQKKAVAIIVGQAIEDTKAEIKKDDEEEEDEEVRHSLFTGGGEPLVHSLTKEELKPIFEDAKRLGSLKDAVLMHKEEGGVLAHAFDTTGMDKATGTQNYGFNDVDMVFPDYRSLNTPPEWLSRNMDWVQKVMNGVHHTPFSRIKSMYADITADEARARGYIKGKQKKEEVFTLLKRTTDPQTIYKLQKMDRDDIIDITDFDVVAWIKAEMQVMLDEEIARAILIGDGRPADSEYKIKEQHIRPIAKDVPLYNTVIKVSVKTGATEAEIAKATIDAIIRGKKKYKGSARPTFWTTEDVQTEMLLIEDQIGHKLYKTETELATSLRVSEIVPVEVMEGQKIQVGTKMYPLVGVICNMADYNVGKDKKGGTEMFDDFDIRYNQYYYLIETRMSGALVKPFSALTIVLNQPTDPPATGTDGDGDEDDET